MSTTKLLQTNEPDKITAFQWQLAFGLPEDGKLVLKHAGDVSLISALLKTVHLVHVLNGVLSYKKSTE
jgi:hypothetical protein